MGPPEVVDRESAILPRARGGREFRPRCGNFIPGTLQFQTVTPTWSPPRLQIYESEYPGRLMEWVNIVFARDDLHVCAVSPAAVCALRESDSINNPRLAPHYTGTVRYQERITRPASAPLEQTPIEAIRH